MKFNSLVSDEFKIRKTLRDEQENSSAHLYTDFGYRLQQSFSTLATQLNLAATIMSNTEVYCVKQRRAPPNELRGPGVTPKDQKEFTDMTPSPDC